MANTKIPGRLLGTSGIGAITSDLSISKSDPILNIARTGNYTYKIGSLANDTFVIQSNETGDASYAPLIEIDSYAHQGSVFLKGDSDGKLGVGATTPTEKVTVNGALAVTGAVSSNPASSGTLSYDSNSFETALSSYAADATAGGGSIAFKTGYGGAAPTERMRIDGFGSVGIGDAAPADKLEINGGSSYPHIRITSSSNTSRYMRIGMESATDHVIEANGSSTLLKFKTAGSERMRIDASGHVGINNSSPAAGSSSLTTLDIKGAIVLNPGTGSPYNSNARHYLLESRYAGSNHLSLGYIANGSTHTAGFVSSQNNLPLYLGVGTADNLVLTSNKNVGLNGGAQIGAGSGFGPANNAAGHGTIKLYNTSNGNMDFNQSYANARYYFYHGGNEVFRIEDGGHSGVYGYSYHYTTTHGSVGIGALNSGYHHTMSLSGPSKFYFNNRCEASGGFHTYSDERLKENITNISGALDKVALMNGVTFNWIDADNRGSGDTGTQFGVIAQNMLTVDPELPSLHPDPLATQEDIDNDELDTDYYSMDYSRITPFLIEAVKELKTKLEAAEARIKTLEG